VRRGVRESFPRTRQGVTARVPQQLPDEGTVRDRDHRDILRGVQTPGVPHDTAGGAQRTRAQVLGRLGALDDHAVPVAEALVVLGDGESLRDAVGALTQLRIRALQLDAERAGDDLRGLACPCQVAGDHDGADAGELRGERRGGLLRLGTARVVERDVGGPLNAVGRVPVGLAVSYKQEGRHATSLRGRERPAARVRPARVRPDRAAPWRSAAAPRSCRHRS